MKLFERMEKRDSTVVDNIINRNCPVALPRSSAWQAGVFRLVEVESWLLSSLHGDIEHRRSQSAEPDGERRSSCSGATGESVPPCRLGIG